MHYFKRDIVVQNTFVMYSSFKSQTWQAKNIGFQLIYLMPRANDTSIRIVSADNEVVRLNLQVFKYGESDKTIHSGIRSY